MAIFRIPESVLEVAYLIFCDVANPPSGEEYEEDTRKNSNAIATAVIEKLLESYYLVRR